MAGAYQYRWLQQLPEAYSSYFEMFVAKITARRGLNDQESNYNPPSFYMEWATKYINDLLVKPNGARKG